jgi:UDP-glucuronate 4-epimerase
MLKKTWANIDNLKNDFKYRSKIDFKEGINNFITWYLSYYEEQNLKN